MVVRGRERKREERTTWSPLRPTHTDTVFIPSTATMAPRGRKSIKKGVGLTLMLVGASGTGRSVASIPSFAVISSPSARSSAAANQKRRDYVCLCFYGRCTDVSLLDAGLRTASATMDSVSSLSVKLTSLPRSLSFTQNDLRQHPCRFRCPRPSSPSPLPLFSH